MPGGEATPMARRANKGTDRLLTGKHWRTTIRGYWQQPANRRPCARCGRRIDYDAPRYWPGTRRVNGASLVVGHIVGRHQAKALGWSDEQINALSNTQPECARCSDSSGATYGNQLRAHPTATAPAQASRPATAARW